MEDDIDDSDISDFFPVKITAVNLVSGVNLYTWKEQSFDTATGAYSDAPGGRSGDSTTPPFLVEINNADNAEFPSYQMARLRGIINGDPYYEFSTPAIPYSLTVVGSNGVVTVPDVDQIKFDFPNGFFVTDNGGGDVTITMPNPTFGSIVISNAGFIIRHGATLGIGIGNAIVNMAFDPDMSVSTNGVTLGAFGGSYRPCYKIQDNTVGGGTIFPGIYGSDPVGNVFKGGLCVTAGTTAFVGSVDASGGTTGLTFSGGPITSSGTLTLSGTLTPANGGTGVSSLTGSGAPISGNGSPGSIYFDVSNPASIQFYYKT